MSTSSFGTVRHWLFREALPFWEQHGVDHIHGGYVEQLRLDATDPQVNFKRTRVTGRQIYVFSHAAMLGYARGADLARHGYEFLTTTAWLGPSKGWARQVDRRGRVIDPTPDLYDLAFVLYALGWFHRATGEPAALDWSLRTLDFLNTQMRHPSGQGFLHEKPCTGPRLQNPHMHLLEAALINFETSHDPRFAALAKEIAGLFRTRLCNPATGALPEFYNEDWTPVAGDEGRTVEPGHQLEWAWILANYQRLIGDDVEDIVRLLVSSAERFGVDASTGMVVNTVRDDGLMLDRGSRVWPNTERIQAAVSMFELFGHDPRPVFESSTRVLMDRFLAPAPRGTWLDRVDVNGKPLVDKIPASTLYHVMIAFAEMLRVENAVARAFPGTAETAARPTTMHSSVA